jgi:hypothetical protein
MLSDSITTVGLKAPSINIQVLDDTFFLDEAWFHLSGYMNSQKRQLQISENQHAYNETPLHMVKICAVCDFSTWGYQFNNL